jgi:hypothetical protein
VLRHAWSQFARKRWLVLYPFALSITGTLAFFAIYAAGGGHLGWSAFFTTDFERGQYIRDHFLSHFSFGPMLAVAVGAGLVFCLFAAMIRAPYYRAIAGRRYPLTPRSWLEAVRLFLLYLFWYLVMWVGALAAPGEGLLAGLAITAINVVGILLIFADYVIVYEDLNPAAAVRRSIQLLGRRLLSVLVIFILATLILVGINALYGLYYTGATQVFALLPISQMLLESLVVLFADLVLIFRYEEIRRGSPA